MYFLTRKVCKYLPHNISVMYYGIKKWYEEEKNYIKNRVHLTTKDHENAKIEKSNFLSVGPLYSSPDQGSRRRLNRPLDRPEVITECTCAFT